MRALSIRIGQWKMQGLNALGKRETTLQITDGLKMRVRTIDHLGHRLASERWFEPNVREVFLKYVQPGMNIIDIGANIGYYTILAAKRIGNNGRVLAIEPQPSVYQNLRRNVSLNDLNSNVTTFQIAASNKEGEVVFHVPEVGLEALASQQLNGRFESKATITLPCRRVDDVVFENQIGHVDLVKIDAEGAELSIFEGMSSVLSGEKKPVLIFEANEKNTEPFGYSVFDLLKRVHEYGYRLKQLDEEDWLALPANAN